MIFIKETTTEKQIARMAGLWYLLLAITASFSWMYITKTFVADDIIKTVSNILATEKQFILSIICSR